MPGPYTFVLPATQLTPETAMTKQKTVGIRVPDAAIPISRWWSASATRCSPPPPPTAPRP